MEVEAVDEGVVESILVSAGTEGVKVNAVIAKLKDEGAASAPAAKPAAAAAQTEAPKAAEPVKAAPAPVAAAPAPAAAKGADGKRIFASPLARRLAAQAGVDLANVKGSGPHGRIVKADLANAPKGLGAPAAGAASAPAQAKTLEQLGIAPGSYDLVPLSGMRKVIAKRLTESFRDIPHFPLTMDLEIDNLLAARTKINALLENEGVKISVNDIVIKASAMALKRVPAANASYTPEGTALHHDADIAMAVAIDGGLITPIIRAAQTKGLAQIARETKDLAARARSMKLAPQEFQGGTFSVSNLGMFGIKTFSSIINEPQGAILSVGAGEQRPVVKNGQLAIATVMSVTLTCDHRVVDGSIGAAFLLAFKAFIDDPATMLA
jgi:pyruvate dehydrogenase E2 component (dihydrolipoamide acetyltransferase)